MTQTISPSVEAPPHSEVIPILDFGSQFAQLIARRVREAGAFSLLVAPDTPAEQIRDLKPRGRARWRGPGRSIDTHHAIARSTLRGLQERSCWTIQNCEV